MRVEQVHGIDDDGAVRCILALGVGELLDRLNGVVMKNICPAAESGSLPVTVGPANVDDAEFRQFVEDHGNFCSRAIVGVNQQCDCGGVHGWQVE